MSKSKNKKRAKTTLYRSGESIPVHTIRQREQEQRENLEQEQADKLGLILQRRQLVTPK